MTNGQIAQKRLLNFVVLNQCAKIHEFGKIENISVDHIYKILLEHLLRAMSSAFANSPSKTHYNESFLRVFRINRFLKNAIGLSLFTKHGFITQQRQRVKADGSVQNKAKSVISAEKVEMSVFWASQSLMLTNYLEKAKQSAVRTMQHC